MYSHEPQKAEGESRRAGQRGGRRRKPWREEAEGWSGRFMEGLDPPVLALKMEEGGQEPRNTSGF